MADLRQRVIDERRARGNWSIRKAAQLGGCSNTAWGDWESGTRELGPIVQAAVAQAFDWPADWPDHITELTASPSPATSDDVAAVREVQAAVEALQAQLAEQADRERVLAREVARLRALLEGPGTPQRLGARPGRRRRTD